LSSPSQRFLELQYLKMRMGLMEIALTNNNRLEELVKELEKLK